MSAPFQQYDQTSRKMGIAVAIAALIAILASNATGPAIWLHYLFKPLSTLLILAQVWLTASPVSSRYRSLLIVGLALSTCGDIFLMLPATVLASGFMCGLGSFLVAHLFFLRALTLDARLFGKPQAPVVYAAIGLINLLILWPTLPADLRIPVTVYLVCLTAMAAQAASRWLTLGTTSSSLAACGGALFVLSDTIIAYDRFSHPVALAAVWILGSYYAALWLLALSARQ